ncbi:DNA polymerase III subunit delta [Helicobacter anatolicus]|uniref:DNA polymerase III subunit delta n=1 Tax=Helicobacter anatolicus TaxID=2905874 RepID=UPI001E2A1112|nr:DNA polymerase III subunit delta [Helicobacter anatolicus]MCE3039616.1 DNA polymerase III subunit delta [Helicobacter anatolicus]
MYKRDFDILLQKELPQGMLFYGDSEFYINFYTKKILDRMPGASINTFYFSDYSISQVLDILGQGSLFGDKSIVVLKLDSKIPKKEVEALYKCLKNNPDNMLIINFFRSENKSAVQYAQDFRSFGAMFRKEGFVDVQFFAPTMMESIILLRQKAEELGIRIADYLLQSLLQLQNNDLGIAMGELEKYQVFDEEITVEILQKLSFGLGSVGLENLLDSIFKNKDILVVYEKILEEGEDEMDMIREIERYFYILFMFCVFIKINGRCDAKEILGYQPPKFIVDKYINRAIKIKEKQFQKIFEGLRTWRNAYLSGEKEAGMRFLINLQANL